jgi:hypothetical protein
MTRICSSTGAGLRQRRAPTHPVATDETALLAETGETFEALAAHGRQSQNATIHQKNEV